MPAPDDDLGFVPKQASDDLGFVAKRQPGSAPGPLETFAAVHGQNATLGLGDRSGGEFQGMLTKARGLADWLTGQPSGGDVEREALRVQKQATEENRVRREEGAAANPWTAGAANVTGQVFNPANFVGLGAAGRVGGAAATQVAKVLPQALARRVGGAVTGSTLAALSSGAQGVNETGSLAEGGRRAVHALPLGLAAGASPALTGAGLIADEWFRPSADAQEHASRILGGGTLVLGSAVHGAPEAPARLKAAGIAQGRRVLTGGADSLSGKAPVSDAVVEEALRSKAIAPFGTTAGAAQRLSGLQESVGNQYGELIKSLEARGVTGPEAASIADTWLQRAVAESTTSLSNQSIPNHFMDQAEAISSKAGESGRLGLTQALEMTRKLQKEARYGKFEETPLNEVKREQASDLRGSIEDEVSRQAHRAPEEAAQFQPVKARLSRLIEAGKAAEKGAAQASRRNAFSLRDTALAAAELAHSGPAKAAEMAVGSHFLRTRIPSAVARGAYGLSEMLSGISPELRALDPALAAPALSARQTPSAPVPLMIQEQLARADELRRRRELTP